MNSKSFLTLTLFSVAPSLLFAQPQPPAEPTAPVAPAGVIRPARPSIAPLLASPATPVAQSELLETPQAPQAPKVAPAAPSASTAPAPPAPPRPVGQMLNVQIEVTLSDTKGTPKTVVLTVADGELGQNRTNSDINVATVGTSYLTFTFNADARPTIVGNKIRLYLSAEANIPASPEAKAGAAANIALRQQQTLILNDGDSVEIARASDPVSDRNFILSVKVKIQR